MTGVQQLNNVRITRARAAKSTSNNNAVSCENQLPPPFPLSGQRKRKKRPAAEDSTTHSSNVAVSPSKHRAALGDVTNIYKDGEPVNCLPRVKTRKVASLGNNSKGRGQGIIQNVNTDTQVTEIKKDMVLGPCNSKDGSSNNAVRIDEKNSNGENVQGAQANSKEPTTITENIPVHSSSKQPVAETKNENASVCANEVLVSSLKQQTCQNQQVLRELKNTSKQGVPAILVKSREGAGCSSRSHYIDIDLDHGDPQMCTAYATEIYDNLRIIELKRRASPYYIETIQQEINANMRGILVDWLVEVAEEYKLVPDTLYLTVSYIDRFLSANVVNRQRLQLLGVTCMLVASKYEEICAPHVEEFCYITDNTYTREEVLEMEIDVLTYLRYDLTTPTTKSFLRRFARAAQTSYKVPSLHLEFMGNYLAELTLVEYDFLRYVPSMIAASAVFVARMTLDPGTGPWNSTLEHYTGYKVSDMKDCIQALHHLQLNSKGCALTAVREKYRQHKFKCVANMSPPPVISPQFLKDQ
ncbi:hypothetical protein SUGI_0339180 [Cryptomeria japonica]|uniref:cyclin-A1-4 n=1 Tax=Cryptomeria japonica TaxID=3369 RepID=UPI002408A617|nr:cyclin-A1-4 [Cryptomeria japonica]XP_057854660.1 cyclin-A1-4 [Cryptomeria japonica]GLJ18967.1 hypothetical protein SUGI_0339180 [Cryptomeria japonica]